MWKKTFIRSTLILLVALAGIFVFATTHTHTTKKPVNQGCLKSEKDCCTGNKTQSEFLIWESLGRAIVDNAQF
jgi:high-affinity Fe2+/Pb2+ permease